MGPAARSVVRAREHELDTTARERRGVTDVLPLERPLDLLFACERTGCVGAGPSPKCILKSDPEPARIVVDSEIVLSGMPR